jgi:predicted ABC-type ATPase
VNREFEAFILANIESRTSFAMETTLRSSVTFEQAALAKKAGFEVEMRYLALDNFAMHLQRVKARADAGGHSASETTLRGIYESSLSNLMRAISEMDMLLVYDNSSITANLRLLLECRRGEIRFEAKELPEWLGRALDTS